MNYSEPIAFYWKKYFEKDEAKYDFDEEKGVFRTGYGLGETCPISSLRYIIIIKEDGFLVRAYIPGIKAKASNFENTAMLLTYINDGMRYGNFEMDMDDGEITFKMANIVPDGAELEYDYIDKNVVIPLMMVKKYADALIGIMLGYTDDPKAAYEKAMAEDAD